MPGPIVRVRILGDASSLQKAAGDASTAIGRLDGLGAGLAGSLAAAFSAAAVIKFARDSVKAASDIEEATNKLQVLLGGSTEKVTEFASTVATKFGISRRAALEQTATFANLFDQLGQSQSTVADMSITMTKLGADIASFSNTSVADAMAAITSGLAGRTMPLRKYGIMLDAATLKERAYSMGLRDTTTGVLPPAIRMQAAYAEILAQTGKQQGDFERTSRSTANSLKSLGAQFDDVKVSVGQALTPVAKDMIGGLRDFLPVAEGAATNTMNLAKSFGFLGGPMDKVALVAGAAALNVGVFAKALGGVQSAIGLLTSAAGPFAAVFAGVATAIGLAFMVQAKHTAEAKETTDGLTEALRAARDPTQVLKDQLDLLNQSMMGTGKAGKEAEDGVRNFNGEWAAGTALRDKSIDGFNRIGMSMEQVAEAAKVGGKAYRAAADESTSSMHDLGEQLDVLHTMLTDVDPAAMKLIDSLYAMVDAKQLDRGQMQIMLGTLASLGEAYDTNNKKAAESSRTYLQLAVANGYVTQGYVDQVLATNASRGANLQWIESARAVKDKLDAAGVSVDRSVAATGAYILAHGSAAEKVKYLRSQIEDLTKAYWDEYDAQFATTDASLAYESATRRQEKAFGDLQEKTDELAKARSQYAADSKEVKEAEEAYNDSLDGARESAKRAADSMLDLMKKQNESGDTSYTSAQMMDAYIGKLRDMRSKATDPTLIAFLDNFTGRLQATGSNAGNAAGQLNAYLSALNGITRNEKVAALAEAGIAAPIPQNATGGPIQGGTATWVGERGPELFVPNTAGNIVPNYQTQALSGGGGGVTIVVNSPIGRPDAVVRWLRDELRRLDRGER